MKNNIVIEFWGARGSVPSPGPKTTKYGGNTSCVSLEFPRQQFFVFDGGSGIKNLGDMLMAQHRRRFHAKIFISHPHWDHVNTIPFFATFLNNFSRANLVGS